MYIIVMANPLIRKTSNPIIIGHRGSGRGEVQTPSGLVRENTIDSFLAAYKMGITWVETDAAKTADGFLVLNHDTVLPDGTPISEISLAEAKKYGLDSLTSTFQSLPDDLAMIVEVKDILEDSSSLYPTTAKLIAQALLEERARSSRPLVTYGFTSAMPLTLNSLINTNSISVGTIAHGGTDLIGMILSSLEYPASVIAAHTSTLIGDRAENQLRPYTLQQAIDRAHSLEKSLLAWTPDLRQAQLLASTSIDALCVDDLPNFLKDFVPNP